jgi:transposase-like protein
MEVRNGAGTEQDTAEFKREAVKLVLEHGVGVREAARRLDLLVGSLRNWVGGGACR